jgi:ketosteroid isomerase-like protein
MNPTDVLPEIVKRAYAGAIDEAMDLYTEDCVMIEKPNVVLRGKVQIRQSLQALVSSGNILSVQMKDVVIAGDIAYSISDWTISFGGATVASGQATDLLRRSSNGDWHMLLDNPFGANAFAPMA